MASRGALGAVITGATYDASTVTGIVNKTLPNFMDEIRNAIYTDNAVLRWQDNLGGIKRGETGSGIMPKLLMAKGTSFTAGSWNSPVTPLEGTNRHMMGFEGWAQYRGGAAIDQLVENINEGPEQLINYLRSEKEGLERDGKDIMNQALISGSGTGTALVGLTSLIPETVSSGTLHGLSRATYTWWRSQSADATCSTTDAAGVVLSLDLRKLINSAAEGQGANAPNLYLCDATTHANVTYYGLGYQTANMGVSRAGGQSNVRPIVTQGAKIPVSNATIANEVDMMIDQGVLVWDHNATADTIRGWNTSNVVLHVARNSDFYLSPTQRAEDSLAKNYILAWAGAFVNHNPKRSLCLYNLNS